MQRDIISSLEEWGTSTRHKPLILKGARQVGKTWALREFGAKSFDNVAYVSLENIAPGIPSEYAQLFERTHDPRRIMRNLTLDDDTLNVPLYLAGHAIRLAKGLARGENAITALS